MRKICDFKNNALKVERVLKTFENLNSFKTMLKNAKNDANIFKNVFVFGFSLFFTIFGFFLKIYQNMGQKLGSNNLIELNSNRSKVLILTSHLFCILYL